MDTTQCKVFADDTGITAVLDGASGFPAWQDAKAGAVVGLYATAVLRETCLDLSSQGFLFSTGNGGFVQRDLVACIDGGLMDAVGLDALRAYGALVAAAPSAGVLAGHPGWMSSTEERGYDLRDLLLLRGGAVIANTIHEVYEEAHDPAFFHGWAILVGRTTSAHGKMVEQGKVAALRAAAGRWAQDRLPSTAAA